MLFEDSVSVSIRNTMESRKHAGIVHLDFLFETCRNFCAAQRFKIPCIATNGHHKTLITDALLPLLQGSNEEVPASPGGARRPGASHSSCQSCSEIVRQREKVSHACCFVYDPYV